MMLVTLAQASAHLRRDTTDDNTDLTLKIEAASDAIVHYLASNATFIDSHGGVDTDTAGDILGVPDSIRIATLILVGILYKDREGENSAADWNENGLPKVVTNLLYGRKTPVIA